MVISGQVGVKYHGQHKTFDISDVLNSTERTLYASGTVDFVGMDYIWTLEYLCSRANGTGGKKSEWGWGMDLLEEHHAVNLIPVWRDEDNHCH
jgi:hypothetical protein